MGRGDKKHIADIDLSYLKQPYIFNFRIHNIRYLKSIGGTVFVHGNCDLKPLIMKNITKSGLLATVLIILVAFSSCEKDEPSDQGNSDYFEHSRDKTGPDVFLKIGRRGKEFRFEDIALYDSSTHILYFKNKHDEFSEVEQGSFYFLDNGHTIYSGNFYPGYSSYIPAGPIILSAPHMYGNYALRIEIWRDDKPDMRNCPRIIEILKQHDLLHSGLSVTVDFLEIDGIQLSFGFTITNHDLTDLLIIDINKTGPNLFHYFTNGLYLRTEDHKEVFSSTITHQKPEPWNSWKPEWLSVLKSGKSISFTINYPIEKAIDPGEYNLTFKFPGLAFQISKDDLFQGSDRIWLGDIQVNKGIAID